MLDAWSKLLGVSAIDAEPSSPRSLARLLDHYAIAGYIPPVLSWPTPRRLNVARPCPRCGANVGRMCERKAIHATASGAIEVVELSGDPEVDYEYELIPHAARFEGLFSFSSGGVRPTTERR